MIGNNGQQFLGTDGFFENAVFSTDIIAHADGASSITFPAKVALKCETFDGTGREIVKDVSIPAADTWVRVYWVVPEDTVADIDPGVANSFHFQISLYGGSGRQVATEDTWQNTANDDITSSTDNWLDATNNYIGFTKPKAQPGQIATPFVARPYEEELVICRQYFKKRQRTADTASFAVGQTHSTSAGIHTEIHDPPMRADPTLVTTGTATDYRVFHAGTGTDCDAVPSKNDGDAHVTGILWNVAGTPFTAGQGALFQSSAANAFLAFNAEI